MKATVPAYVRETVKDQVNRVLPAVQKNLPAGEKPDALFISISPSEGVTNYSVWLFSEHLVIEIRNPHIAGRIQHDLGPFKNSVDWIRLDAHDFDFEEEVHPESRLRLEFTTMDGLTGELFAKGEDACRGLMSIYHDKLLPNFLWVLNRHED